MGGRLRVSGEEMKNRSHLLGYKYPSHHFKSNRDFNFSELLLGAVAYLVFQTGLSHQKTTSQSQPPEQIGSFCYRHSRIHIPSFRSRLPACNYELIHVTELGPSLAARLIPPGWQGSGFLLSTELGM